MHVASRILATALVFSGAVACSVPVAVSLDDAEASRAIENLEKDGIAAHAVTSMAGRGKTVAVGRADAERALAVLAERPPRSSSPTLMDVFGEPGMVPSRLAERARLASGVAGDLERTLRRVDGVVHARVHVSIPETSPLVSDRPGRPTASVLIVHDSPQPVFTPDDVQRLVAGAVADLAPASVTVVMSAAGPEPHSRAELAQLGPITTTRDGLAIARTAVLVVVLVNLLLLALLVVLWRRSARQHAPAPQGDVQ